MASSGLWATEQRPTERDDGGHYPWKFYCENETEADKIPNLAPIFPKLGLLCVNKWRSIWCPKQGKLSLFTRLTTVWESWWRLPPHILRHPLSSVTRYVSNNNPLHCCRDSSFSNLQIDRSVLFSRLMLLWVPVVQANFLRVAKTPTGNLSC